MAGEILIVGAGIGGLTTALSLHDAGHQVRVFETVDAIRPLGVGINLLPHAVREMDELGVRPALEKVGIATAELSYHTTRGERIWSEPRGLEAGYRWPQISLHRGVLQMTLFDAVLERIGADRVHLAHHLDGYDADDHGVTARFVDRRTGAHAGTHRGLALVAADGIHSAVRALLYPDEGGPKWNGAVMWRGVVPGPPFHRSSTVAP
ncbi:MAG: FAD-dependent monooxygenase [Acidimicrobiia bacterium]|nr:FAD-dependent monooxygenase [Acidimicrobiia bacterium]